MLRIIIVGFVVRQQRVQASSSRPLPQPRFSTAQCAPNTCRTDARASSHNLSLPPWTRVARANRSLTPRPVTRHRVCGERCPSHLLPESAQRRRPPDRQGRAARQAPCTASSAWRAAAFLAIAIGHTDRRGRFDLETRPWERAGTPTRSRIRSGELIPAHFVTTRTHGGDRLDRPGRSPGQKNLPGRVVRRSPPRTAGSCAPSAAATAWPCRTAAGGVTAPVDPGAPRLGRRPFHLGRRDATSPSASRRRVGWTERASSGCGTAPLGSACRFPTSTGTASIRRYSGDGRFVVYTCIQVLPEGPQPPRHLHLEPRHGANPARHPPKLRQAAHEHLGRRPVHHLRVRGLRPGPPRPETPSRTCPSGTGTPARPSRITRTGNKARSSRQRSPATARFVAFVSQASDLVPHAAGTGQDVFIWEPSYRRLPPRITDGNSQIPSRRRLSWDRRRVTYKEDQTRLHGRQIVYMWAPRQRHEHRAPRWTCSTPGHPGCAATAKARRLPLRRPRRASNRTRAYLYLSDQEAGMMPGRRWP